MADNLTRDQKNKIDAFKVAYADAQKRGDKAGMDAAHKGAEDIRAQSGYSGGADGSQYIPMQPQKNPVTGITPTPRVPDTSRLSMQDRNLSTVEMNKLNALKDAYAQAQAAGDRAAMDQAHADAEAIRKQHGYSGNVDGFGGDGTGRAPGTNPLGGMTADEMALWVDDYTRANTKWYNPKGHYVWSNGYSVPMNLRSLANKIRQQMEANSNAYGAATPEQREYLHQQNIELEKILRANNGGAESHFNPQTGRWETDNANLGYGINIGGGYDDREFNKNFYGMTDEQIDAYINDTSRYHNFVDQSVVRNWVDESSGYTGRYSQFANGPYALLMTPEGNGTHNGWNWTDVIGDGFNEDNYRPVYDKNGNIVPQPPAMKNNQFMTDYTRDKAGYVVDGVIQPNILNGLRSAYSENRAYRDNPQGVPHYTESAEHPVNPDWEDAIRRGYGNHGGYQGSFQGGSAGTIDPGMGVIPGGGFGGSISGGSTTGGGSDFSSMINQMMDANLAAQKAALEQAYKEATGMMDTSIDKSNAAFEEQKRQVAGQSDLDAANWREIANAQGLNSGAIGQAALAQNNQLQSDLSSLGAAQSTALADMEQQRALLGQEYTLQIQKAKAENDWERARMLYQEAVRVDEAMRQQQQFNASLAASQANKVLGTLSKGGLGGLGGFGFGGFSSGAIGGSIRPPKGGGGGNRNPEPSDNPLLNPDAKPETQNGGDSVHANLFRPDDFMHSFMPQLKQLEMQGDKERLYDIVEANISRFTPAQRKHLENYLNGLK